MNGSQADDWPAPMGTFSPDELVLAAVPLIETIVDEMAARVRGPVDQEHLTSVAIVAALDAATSYVPQEDGPFPRYLNALLRSALLGEVRSRVRAVPVDRMPAEPAEDDEAIAALCQLLHELSERELELTDDLMDTSAPDLLGELIQVRTEALALVQQAMLAREAAPAGSPEEAAARGSAFAAVLGTTPLAPRATHAPATTSRWPLRREA